MSRLNPSTNQEGSRLADYTERMSNALMRRNAELEARAARVEAELAIKARSEFLANVNHELRTPLNAIIGFATMLRDGDEYAVGPEQIETYAEYILQSADLLLGHINTVLEVAALESGQVELSDEVIDFRVVLTEAVNRANVRANAANVSIEQNDDGADVVGWGDGQRLAQATDHLLQTAIKLSGEGARIVVQACITDQGWAEIAVRDEGAGLTAEELYQALDAFQEIHRGLDRSFSGPGIGYAVSKTFIEMQGGRFFIESRKGEGTLVRISLPQPDVASAPIDDVVDETEEKHHDAA